MNDFDRLILTGEQMITSVQNNLDDIENIEEEYNLDDPDSEMNAVHDLMETVQYANNNLQKLGSVMRLMAAEALLQREEL